MGRDIQRGTYESKDWIKDYRFKKSATAPQLILGLTSQWHPQYPIMSEKLCLGNTYPHLDRNM